MNEREEIEVNLVQEVAKSCYNRLPLSFVLKEEDRPNGVVPLVLDIPVIDLSHLSQSNCGSDETEKLRAALQSWGLFQAIGHGMSLSFLDEVRDIAKRFFQLPMEIKQKYSVLKEGTAFKFEGYGNDHIAADDQILDWNDRLFLLVEPENERKLDLWPENPTSFRNALHEYTTGSRKALEQILRSMAKLLDLDEYYFIHQLNGAETLARFNYYPSCLRPDLVLGLKPHSDGSFITIVLLDKEVEGLQVMKDGVWIKFPVIPHALLVNLGSQLEVMCNGIFKSPMHRVVANKGERVSLAMFYLLDQEKELEPAPDLVDKMRTRFYNKVKVKDFNEAYFRSVSLGKNVLDWLKANNPNV